MCKNIIRKLLILFLLVIPATLLLAQQPAGKRIISPAMGFKESKDSLFSREYILRVTDLERARNLLKAHHLENFIKNSDPVYRMMTVELPFSTIDKLLLKNGLVDFIDRKRVPKEETIVPGFDPGLNNLTKLFSRHPQWNGKGIVISIKEQRFDTADLDLQARTVFTGEESPQLTTHATRMATMSAGAGNTLENSKGAAWAAFLSSASFEQLMPESPQFYQQNNISVQNHSYGTAIENYYAADAAAYDTVVFQLPYLLHVFSAGNLGEEMPEVGQYSGLPFANLSGSFKMSKNSLSVGAVDSFSRPEQRSSRGPAYDGRIKPELVAFGQEGSSGAAAIVSGIGASMQELYKRKHGKLPPSSLLKAILLNTATDLETLGPDFITGFGNANAFKALEALDQQRFIIDTLDSNQADSINIEVPDSLSFLKIMLSWTDPPAEPLAQKALVNDLNLILVDPDGSIYHPWILNTAAHPDSLKHTATRGVDTLNNNEQVSIFNPKKGIYRLVVKASKIHEAQSYAITWDFQNEQFEWNYPTGADKVLPGIPVLLRWNAGLKGTGRISYSLNNQDWIEISGVPLSQPYFYWTPPAVTTLVRLRMQVGQEFIESDTFTLSRWPVIVVGFACTDSFMVHWDRSSIDSFRLYQAGTSDPFLIPTNILYDSFYLGPRTSKEIIAIAPMIGGKEGSRSYATDYTMQGTGCYVENLLVDIISGQGNIQAWLGTIFQLASVSLEKMMNPGGWTTIRYIQKPSQSFFRWNDSSLVQGINRYRLKLQLEGGKTIYSNEEQVFYLDNKSYLLYPNPTLKNGSVKIAIADHEGLWFSLFDLAGRKLLDRNMEWEADEVSLAGLPAGIYFYRFTRNGQQESSGKLVIR